MNTSQVTTTGIAVALAVVIALGLLFFGPQIFSMFTPQTGAVATTTDIAMLDAAAGADTTTTMNTEPIPNPLPTTLTVTDQKVGTGAEAVSGKTVTVNYVGMLPNGQVFDASASHGQPFSFTLGAGQVIQGWDMGVAGMKVGGQRRLIIPADLAYGSQGAGGAIPPNATLIFDVELLDVQ
jgi:FKBP-type peptidyl-prolyl cis-trans isomerase